MNEHLLLPIPSGLEPAILATRSTSILRSQDRRNRRVRLRGSGRCRTGHAGARLYAGLFNQARRAGHEIVVCEVNQDPPNLASDALHASLGFAEIGRAAIRHGTKTVRYLLRRISPAQ